MRLYRSAGVVVYRGEPIVPLRADSGRDDRPAPRIAADNPLLPPAQGVSILQFEWFGPSLISRLGRSHPAARAQFMLHEGSSISMARRWTLYVSSVLAALSLLAAPAVCPRSLGQDAPQSDPADNQPDDAKPDDAKPDAAKPDAAKPDEAKPDEAGKNETAKKLSDDDYELYQIFADTLDQVERNYVKDVSRRELMEAAIHGVLSKLDPYSNYISPDDISRFKTTRRKPVRRHRHPDRHGRGPTRRSSAR